MEQRTKKIVAWLGIGLGLGAGVYAADKGGLLKLPSIGTSPQNYVGSPNASFQPGLTTPYPLGVSIATISWQNTSTKAVTYGVQGYIVASGTVDGHWWSSLANAQSALSAARAGGATALSQYTANVADRVATVQVAAGGTGTVKLYAQLATQESETWIFLVRPNYTGGLIAMDPQGAPAGNIAQVGDIGLTVQVQVG